MINSHKEFVTEIKNFANKMELINDFKYLKDITKLNEELLNSKPRVLIIGLEGVSFDDENYNARVKYRFVISESCLYEEGAILAAESDNIFIVSALKDYLYYITDVDIELNDIDSITESDAESTFSSISGAFSILIKRSPSYWKKMDAYNVD